MTSASRTIARNRIQRIFIRKSLQSCDGMRSLSVTWNENQLLFHSRGKFLCSFPYLYERQAHGCNFV